jgi:hypothetical protein
LTLNGGSSFFDELIPYFRGLLSTGIISMVDLQPIRGLAYGESTFYECTNCTDGVLLKSDTEILTVLDTAISLVMKL